MTAHHHYTGVMANIRKRVLIHCRSLIPRTDWIPWSNVVWIDGPRPNGVDVLCPAVSEAAHCFTKWLQVTIVPPLRGLPWATPRLQSMLACTGWYLWKHLWEDILIRLIWDSQNFFYLLKMSAVKAQTTHLHSVHFPDYEESPFCQAFTRFQRKITLTR